MNALANAIRFILGLSLFLSALFGMVLLLLAPAALVIAFVYWWMA